MSSSILRRLIVVLALSAFLGSPATSLAGPRSAARHPRTQAAAQTPLSWLWNALVSVWEKEWGAADPYGQRLASPPESLDNGCELNPYGQCINNH